MRIAFLGTGDFAVPALRALRAAGHTLTLVISQPDRPAGRGRGVRPTPVRAAAEELGLRHVQTDDVNALDAPAVLDGATLGVVAAFGQKIGPAMLTALRDGCVNIHGSLLPKYRGAAPYQWAILNGERTTGVTVFRLNERWDAGDVLAARSTPIGTLETADELHDRLALLGAELIVPALADWTAGRIGPQPQQPGQATRAPKLSKTDGRVDWSRPAPEVQRRIHGLWSWPAAATRFVSRQGRAERVLLARATLAGERTPPTPDCPPGTVAEDGTVQTGSGRLRILEVLPAGGKLMPFDAFARGRRITAGDRFMPLEDE